MQGSQEVGIFWVQVLQMLSPALDGLMKGASFLGTPEFYLLLFPLIYWNINPRIGFRTLLLLVFTDTASTSVKLLFRQPRPYWIGQVRALADEPTYGLPSNHASDSLAIWGYLAYRAKRSWLTILVIFLILLIGISRIYLAVHFPHDVLAGWVIGLVMLFLFIRLDDSVSQYLASWGDRAKIILGFGLSMGIILMGVFIKAAVSGVPDPESWVEFSSSAQSLSYFFTLGGACFGSISGYVLMRSRLRFIADGTTRERILRYLVGILSVLLLWQGLDLIFSALAQDDTLIGFGLRYLRYAATIFWAFYGAVWLFIKLRLVEKDNTPLEDTKEHLAPD